MTIVADAPRPASDTRRANNRRLALILLSIAAAFFLGFVLERWLLS